MTKWYEKEEIVICDTLFFKVGNVCDLSLTIEMNPCLRQIKCYVCFKTYLTRCLALKKNSLLVALQVIVACVLEVAMNLLRSCLRIILSSFYAIKYFANMKIQIQPICVLELSSLNFLQFRPRSLTDYLIAPYMGRETYVFSRKRFRS